MRLEKSRCDVGPQSDTVRQWNRIGLATKYYRANCGKVFGLLCVKCLRKAGIATFLNEDTAKVCCGLPARRYAGTPLLNFKLCTGGFESILRG